MKKLLFLGSICLLYCFSSDGQTLSASSVVEPGQESTVRVNGEITGATVTYGGRAQSYHVDGSPGSTYVWSVPVKRGTVQSGQGTNSVTIFFNNFGGGSPTLPYTVLVGVTITDQFGVATILSLPVTVNQCNDCPII